MIKSLDELVEWIEQYGLSGYYFKDFRITGINEDYPVTAYFEVYYCGLVTEEIQVLKRKGLFKKVWESETRTSYSRKPILTFESGTPYGIRLVKDLIVKEPELLKEFIKEVNDYIIIKENADKKAEEERLKAIEIKKIKEKELNDYLFGINQ